MFLMIFIHGRVLLENGGSVPRNISPLLKCTHRLLMIFNLKECFTKEFIQLLRYSG